MDVDLSGLAAEWDGDLEIRQRIREGGKLLHEDTNNKILVKTASINFRVLFPVVQMMAKCPETVEEGQAAPSPAVESLRAEVKALFDLNQKAVDWEGVDKTAWAVRKFIAFLKLKIRKREVSLEALLAIRASVCIETSMDMCPGVCVVDGHLLERLRIRTSRPCFWSWTRISKILGDIIYFDMSPCSGNLNSFIHLQGCLYLRISSSKIYTPMQVHIYTYIYTS